MLMKQISVFIENKPGRLADVTGVLADSGINMHALSIADTSDFGILRMILSDAGSAEETLKKNGFTVKSTDVVAVSVAHTPGSLHKVLCELEKLDISIEYMYAFTSRPKDHDAIVILRLNNQEQALEKLMKSDVRLLGSDMMDKLNEIE